MLIQIRTKRKSPTPALDMLKLLREAARVSGTSLWLTPCCQTPLERKDNFCGHCGAALPRLYSVVYGVPIFNRQLHKDAMRELKNVS